VQARRRAGLLPTRSGCVRRDVRCFALSIYLLRAAAFMLERDKKSRDRAVYYVSSTDYVQHHYAPHEPEAVQFYSKVAARAHGPH
jgi:hypothetical protein